ncbi:heme ABC transporter permease CcmC [Pseudomonadota bacterium]|nr:heme ABC transporter permease CcmC [Pseudomonadota bacterium]
MIKKFFHQFASPKSYFAIANKFGKPVLAFFFLLYIGALVWGLFFTPPDVVQGDSYRIIYMHVPASFMAQILFVVMAITSAVFLIWKLKLAAYVSKSIAPIGAIVTFFALFSGSIWGIPTWGTWWQWDARITSTLILFIMYLGLISLHASFENKDKADKFFSVLVLIGVVNIPVIKKSVDWWSTLHQSASITLTSKPSIDPVMLYPLMFSIVAFIGLIFGLVILSSQNEILKREKYKSWVKNI